MKYLTFKVRKIVKMVLLFENNKLLYKYLYKNTRLPYIIRQKAFCFLDKFALSTSYIRIRRRCIITNSPSYVFKYFKLSRRALHAIMHTDGWCGSRASSW